MPNPRTRDELIAYLTKSFEPDDKIFVVDMFDKEALAESLAYEYHLKPIVITDEIFERVCLQLEDNHWFYESIRDGINKAVDWAAEEGAH